MLNCLSTLQTHNRRCCLARFGSYIPAYARLYIPKINLVLALAVYILFTAVSGQAASPAVETIVRQKLIPAYQVGDLHSASKLALSLIERGNPRQTREVDDLLEQLGAVSLSELVLERRLQLLLGYPEGKQSRIGLREAITITPLLYRRIDRERGAIAADARNQSLSEGAGLEQYQAALQQIQVLTDRMRNVERMAEYGSQINKVLDQYRAELTDSELKHLDLNFETTLAELRHQREVLEASKTDLQLAAIAKAIPVLRESRDFEARLRAAYLIGEPADEVLAYLQTPSDQRVVLPDTFRDDLALARQASGDLRYLAQLLYRGMDWWRRGRYGIGPQQLGLRQPHVEDTATLSLYFQPELAPRFERRHHFCWSRDPARVTTLVFPSQQNVDSRGYYSTNRRADELTKNPVLNSMRPTTRIAQAEANQLGRLVGFHEYAWSLHYFDELLRRLTDERIAVVDKLLASDPQFHVAIHLSHDVQSLSNSVPQRMARLDAKSTRYGLAWVMALARVELGAMRATFTDTPYPFTSVKHSDFERKAYKSLLLDGVRTHYWSLHRDERLRHESQNDHVNAEGTNQQTGSRGSKAQTENAQPPTLDKATLRALRRRVKLTRAMLRASVKAGVGEFDATQFRELAGWSQDLERLQRILFE